LEQVDEIINTFDGYLRKPITKHQLLKEISKFLENQSVLPSKEFEIKPVEKIEKFSLNNTNDYSEEMKLYFKSEIIPFFEAVNKSLYISKIKQFCEILSEFGNKYSYPRAIDFADSLMIQADNFKIDKIKQILNNFNPIIIELK